MPADRDGSACGTYRRALIVDLPVAVALSARREWRWHIAGRVASSSSPGCQQHRCTATAQVDDCSGRVFGCRPTRRMRAQSCTELAKSAGERDEKVCGSGRAGPILIRPSKPRQAGQPAATTQARTTGGPSRVSACLVTGKPTCCGPPAAYCGWAHQQWVNGSRVIRLGTRRRQS